MSGRRNRLFPLQHVRVIDLTNVIAGPVATRVLGQLGAQVIKIELPWGRAVGAIALHTQDVEHPRPYNTVASFNEVNRAKLSLPINLAHQSGKKLFLKLVGVSDVVIENYSPRVMDNLGLRYEKLVKVRPDLIMVSMPALGDPGPWSNYISFGPGAEALAGLCDITGYEGGPPHKPGNFYADQNSAFHVATAIMAAIWNRRRTGRGRHLKIVLRDTTIAIMGEYLLEYQLTGRPPQRIGNRHPTMIPHNVYRCKGDDAWVAIAVADDDEWRLFCTAVGDPQWCRDSRFASVGGRRSHQEELDCLIQSWTEVRTPYEVMHTLQAEGVKAGVVMKAPDILADPQYAARDFVDHTLHPDGGAYKHPGLPWKFSSASTKTGYRAPLFAEHSGWILRDLLDLEKGEIARLMREATVPLEPVPH
ncbi:MAG: CaiB/BaiF CoA transferase family protein [Dehalococcoidia bacterium]